MCVTSTKLNNFSMFCFAGTVNCLAFTPNGSHLFACSSDGSISAIRCGNWQIEKHLLKAHKGFAVNTIAIHQSGKLALSTGEDGVLRTWNLIKGRQAYATNLIPKLKVNAKWITVVKWSPDGDKYLLAANRNVYVYSVETAGIEKEFTFDSKVTCVEFLKNTLIAIGHENGTITFYDLALADPHVTSTKAHDMRVKCIAHMCDLLVSASTSGEIKLWRYDGSSMRALQTVNCGARITCLSLAKIYKHEKTEDTVEVKDEEKDLTREGGRCDLTKEVVEVIDEEKEDPIEEKKIDEKNLKVKSTNNNRKVKTLQIPNREKGLVEKVIKVKTDKKKSLIERKDKRKTLKVNKSKKNKKVKMVQIPSKRSHQDTKKRKLKEESVHTSKKKKKKTVD